MIRNQILLVACVFALAILPTAVPSHAAVINLSNQNTFTQINPDAPGAVGQLNWFVDATNQLASQWFYLKVGNGAVQPVNMLSAATVSNQTTNSVMLTYTQAGLATVNLTFTLLGSALGSGTADLAVQAGVTNLTGATANVSLFEFANFDLNGSAANDTVSFPSGTQITQTKGATTVTEDTVISAFQGHEGNTPGTVLGAVTTNTLNNLPAIGGSVGPGDESWAVRWDRTLGVNGAFTVSKDENITGGAIGQVPEPSSIMIWGLIGLTFGGVSAARRRS